jgi:stage II sporulation protein D
MKPTGSAQIIIITLSLLWRLFPAYAQEPADLRVAIIKDALSLRIAIEGSYEINDFSSGRLLSAGKALNTTVTIYDLGILLGNIKAATLKVLIKAKEISINGQVFEGSAELIKRNNSSLLVVNRVGLENYVKGILFHEVSHYWPMEALKAQAVISRTYALYQAKENKLKDYDLTADVYSQVYGGSFAKRYRTDKAVDQTEGEILTYQGSVFPAYFHSTCGGQTEDASSLWNIDIAPLRGRICGFCQGSPHFNWHYVLSLKELGESLIHAGYNLGDIKMITVISKNRSGRNSGLKISGIKKDLMISAKDLRGALGPDIIRSTRFNVSISGTDAVFSGLGWGHGVGLCQWGAYFMAKEGYKYEQILGYYYSDAELKRYQKIKD